jgi:DNA-binding MarR family transcriptional regulator
VRTGASSSTTSTLDARLADHTGSLARLVAVRAEASLRAALPAGRSMRDLAVLAVLAEVPMSQAQLGTLLHVNRTVMISVIDDIEAAGYAQRQRDPADRRRYALQITDEGRAVLPRLRTAAGRAERNLLASWTVRTNGPWWTCSARSYRIWWRPCRRS